MIRYITTFCLIILFYSVTYSQVLKGRITSVTGDPIPYSTVFIQELKQGTTANTKGNYELKLKPGKYLVTYQSLGFSPVFSDLTISEDTIIKNVVLEVQYYEIPEVRISATGEDPAYNIMRKAIGMAPYYLNNVDSYKAEVYIKGNLVFKRIPRMVQKSMKIDSDGDDSTTGAEIKEGEVYIMESFNEIEFKAPDKYIQRVISVNSTFPDQGDNVSPMDIIKASFYQPVIADIAISPLSPQAFSYYRFKYLGATLQGENTINKIQVIPRMKSQQLFEGIIYIIEDLWCLHSVDLINNNIAGRISIEQLYIPVQDNIWMPVSLRFEMEIGILGFRADAGYGTSLRYTNVKPNNGLLKPDKPLTGPSVIISGGEDVREKAISKDREKIERIMEKENPSNRDMVTMARLMKKESERSVSDTTANDNEITERTTRIIEKDASRKDSSYWAAIRPIPLSDAEIRSIRIRDSIRNGLSKTKTAIDTATSEKYKARSRFVKGIREITSDHTWSDTSGLSFTFGGLVDPENLRFNSVDGFVYGFDLRLSKEFKNSNSFYLAPEIDYAFSRQRLLWRINSAYSFKKEKQRTVFFRTGVMSTDIANGGSINPFLNSLTSLLLKKNYLKLYESSYFFSGFRGEITKGLRLEFSGGFEKRKVLENYTDFSFFRKSREYTPNIPVNEYLAEGSDPSHALRDQIHYEFTTIISFTPGQKNRMKNSGRLQLQAGWPSLNVQWKHGINEFTEPERRYIHYDMIRLEVSQEYETGAFSDFRWRIRTGGFLNNQYLPFIDFSHFNIQTFPLMLNDYQDAFNLPGYYSLSTPGAFGEIHFKYTTPYFLLKYLPGMSNTLIRENISLACLGSHENSVYTELGYSMTELFLLGEAGLYAGFDNMKFRSFGLKFILKIN